MKTRILLMAAMMGMAALLFTPIPGRASGLDDRIEAEIKRSYVFKTYLRDDTVQAHSLSGIVTLSGSVVNEDHRTMAEQTVASMTEVRSVNNLLTIFGPPAIVNSDNWLRERIAGALLMYRSVNLSGTDVSVIDGRVTLKGEVGSEAQLKLVSIYSADVAGVKSVDNQMTVNESLAPANRTSAELIDDASITSQARMALIFHHGVDVFDTRVSTRRGTVTLVGTAKNQAEIDLATRRVQDIHGVKRVNNRMTIEAARSSTN